MHSPQLTIKRLLDVILCALVLICGCPVFLIIAVLVKASSPGPIFFVQERVGLNGGPFRLYKFRTMVGKPPQNQEAASWTAAEEARITRIGHFLRDYGLDELPQVINILKGDMSIIGPRPPLPAVAETFNERQRRTFRMRPGVLSLAAIKGRRSISMENRVDLHVEYVDNWSLWLDCVIAWKSLTVVLGRRDASEIVAVPQRGSPEDEIPEQR